MSPTSICFIFFSFEPHVMLLIFIYFISNFIPILLISLCFVFYMYITWSLEKIMMLQATLFTYKIHFVLKIRYSLIFFGCMSSVIIYIYTNFLFCESIFYLKICYYMPKRWGILFTNKPSNAFMRLTKIISFHHKLKICQKYQPA